MSSRLVCINSRKIPEGSSNKGDDYTVELGKKIIACKGQCIKASLQEFTMPKVWTDVNANNNTLRSDFSFSGQAGFDGTGDVIYGGAPLTIRPANYGSIHDLAASLADTIGNHIVKMYQTAQQGNSVKEVDNWRCYGGSGLVVEPGTGAGNNPGLCGIRSCSSLTADKSDDWSGGVGFRPGGYPQITPHSLTTISGTTDNIISFTICFQKADGSLVSASSVPLLNFGSPALWCDPSDGDSAQLLGCDNGTDYPIYCVQKAVFDSANSSGNAMKGLQVICKYPAVRFTSPNIYIRSNLAGETLSNNAFSQQIGDDESNKMNETDIIGICNVNTEILHTRNTDFRFRIDSDQVSKIRIYVTDEQGRPIGRARDSTLKTATTNTKAPFSSTQPAYPPGGDENFPSVWVDSGLPTTQLPANSIGTKQSTSSNLNFQATIRFDIEDEYNDHNKCS